MKKTYIKPETVVVALNVRDTVLQATSNVVLSNTEYDPASSGEIQSREVIKTPDAWEEW